MLEASGLVASRQSPKVLWTHNDSGHDATLFAVSTSGRALGSYLLSGATAVDWEDIAVGPGPQPGQWQLYVGDIGTNNAPRDHVVVYRVREPKVKAKQKSKHRRLEGVERLRLRYPGGRSPDSEVLIVDPDTSDLYLVTKSFTGESGVYRARAPLSEATPTALQLVAHLHLGPGDFSAVLATGGDIAPDGSAILIRTYSRAYLWSRRRGTPIANALRGRPCRIPLKTEPQGESIAFSADSTGYFTVSEGRHPPLYFFEQRD